MHFKGTNIAKRENQWQKTTRVLWNHKLLAIHVLTRDTLKFQIEDTALKKLTQLKKGIKFEARGHPLINYAKGRGEGGLKIRNSGGGGSGICIITQKTSFLQGQMFKFSPAQALKDDILKR